MQMIEACSLRWENAQIYNIWVKHRAREKRDVIHGDVCDVCCQEVSLTRIGTDL
jgi:hypothetical protein